MKYDKVIAIEDLSEESFKDLGVILRIPVEGEMEPIIQSSFFKHYGPLGFIECQDPTELGITTFKKREFIVEELEQHAQTHEMLFAIDGDFVMPVAPIVYENGVAYPDETKIKAIRVKQGEGVIFKQGYWHYAPFPIKDVSSVLVGFKKGTAVNDITMCKLKTVLLMEAG